MASISGKYTRLALIGALVIVLVWVAHSVTTDSKTYHYFQEAGSQIDHHTFEEHGSDPGVTTHVREYLINLKAVIESTASTTQEPNERVGSYIKGQNITALEVYNNIESILDLNSDVIPRLQCPGEQTLQPRYQILKPSSNQTTSETKIQYLFAINLYQSTPILNRLIASVIQAIRSLDPSRCAVSIVEGRSTDGTFTILSHLEHYFQEIGTHYYLNSSTIDPHAQNVDRISQLAALRNTALSPLLTDPALFVTSPQIIFLNDITLCPNDIFELLYQHTLQNATQTCAMDWAEGGQNFYDVWVSRSMTGNIFWEIPQDGSWAFAQNLFYDDPFTKKKFARKQPFQVFSCWGGASVIEGAPFMRDSLRFRRSVEGECYGGEPQILGMDFAKLGISRVQSVPSVNVGYDSNEAGAAVKKVRGYVYENVDVKQAVLIGFEQDVTTERIRWKPPPARIRCMPDLGSTYWVDPWYDPAKVEDDG